MFGKSLFQSHQHNDFEFLKISKGTEDSPDLVFLHGMFGGLSNYDALVDYIDDYNIYVPSIPLYDFSVRQLKFTKMAKWLHSFMEEMDIKNPILLGNSMGGHLALEYTVQNPDNVAALILTGSSGLQERDFGSTFPRRNDRDYVRQQAAITFYDDDFVTEELMDEIMEVINDRGNLLNVLAIARETHEYSMEKYLPEIKQDVLLIWGKQDEITPPEVAEQFHKDLPNSRLKWIDECGHAPMMEHPKKFALYLNEFLVELKNKNATSIQ
ncbi:alpha/beta hydrolase [Fodinibius sp. Rm-B-1B1-1]|uniref:alpha/beta fold hydrolase n=1 Tax=Fodinibius alkaliphilus TaxID=3140241 RepID=UPI00315AF480